MNSGSVRPESMGWLHSLEFPGLKLPVCPISKIQTHCQVKDGNIYVSDSKMEKRWRKQSVLAVF